MANSIFLVSLDPSNPTVFRESKEYTRHGSKLQDRTDPLVYQNKARRFIAVTYLHSNAYSKELDTLYPIWKTKCILSIQLNGLRGKKKTVKMKIPFKYRCDLSRL